MAGYVENGLTEMGYPRCLYPYCHYQCCECQWQLKNKTFVNCSVNEQLGKIILNHSEMLPALDYKI